MRRTPSALGQRQRADARRNRKDRGKPKQMHVVQNGAVELRKREHVEPKERHGSHRQPRATANEARERAKRNAELSPS
jgi:hypothetical protein